ncbi:stretch-activated cation channel mid1 [Thecaphora frezii]
MQHQDDSDPCAPDPCQCAAGKNMLEHEVPTISTCSSSSRPLPSEQRRGGRQSSSRLLWTSVILATLLLGLLPFAGAQATSSPTSSISSTATVTPTVTSTSLSIATATPVALNDSTVVRSHLDLNATSGAFFNFTVPASAYAFDNTVRTWVSLSLCSGPTINPYNITNTTLLESLGMSADEAQAATNVRMYVSSDSNKQQPGPDTDGISSNWKGYAQGGWVALELDVRQRNEDSDQPIWIGIWPPADLRNQTSGTYELQLVTSTVGKMESVDDMRRGRLDDTDTTNAVFLSFNYTDPAPNLTAIVLPTQGRFSLASVAHFNSSFCAINDAWNALQQSTQNISIASTETDRFSLYNSVTDDRRRQFQIGGLQPGTNYTAWLVQTEVINNDTSKGLTYTLFPAFKMLTKRNEFCRLVHDVPFCPNVAYSIPVNPDVSTERALAIINETVTPNYANFSRMIDTFPCGDPAFGMYSYVQSCDSCKQSYLDWLCAIAMPRCTDTLDDPSSQSWASQDGRDLTGAPTGLNTELLPYIVNRNASTSRRSYIGQELRAGAYGELLPCIYNCYYVERTCPPFVSWSCPVWDVTAQRDYGTFADSGGEGIGAAENGGAGSDGTRWGGPQRYVSIDGFGNAFCNALGVDIRLLESNSARSSARISGWAALVPPLLVVAAAIL